MFAGTGNRKQAHSGPFSIFVGFLGPHLILGGGGNHGLASVYSHSAMVGVVHAPLSLEPGLPGWVPS